MFATYPSGNPRFGAVMGVGPTDVYRMGRSFPGANPTMYGYYSRQGKYPQRITQGDINKDRLISTTRLAFQGHNVTSEGLGGLFTGAVVTIPLMELRQE
jgi:hypothetical protein